MDSDNKNKKINEEQDGFGKIVDALHNKKKLPTLRTYQGDMAEFIKEKNESVISVSLKEKKRREEEEKRRKEEEERLENEKKLGGNEKKEEEEKNIILDGTIIVKEGEKRITKKNNGFQTNLIITISSILLVIGGAYVLFSVLGKVIDEDKNRNITNQTEIIPYSNLINANNITKESFSTQLSEITTQGGINIIKISNTNGDQIKTSIEFFDFLDVQIPGSLRRDLFDEYAFGKYKKGENESNFLIIKVRDFGRAFSSMLEWEDSILNNLGFILNVEVNTNSSRISWIDEIIKNKDVRALVNNEKGALILYTFLDKNTILITTSEIAIEEISNVFASRAFAR